VEGRAVAWLGQIRFADQEVNMLGHNYIAVNVECNCAAPVRRLIRQFVSLPQFP
jgi:hypothetical protein